MTQTTSPGDIADQLLAGNFARTVPVVGKLSDPLVDTPMVVTLDELRPYEFNPRIVRNPLYDEIKASIRERGLDAPPAITRRPGESHFIIRNGGNTRLSILKELWTQTKEERFFKIHCLFRPWQSEIVALTGHLAENELHGSLTFIERALAVGKAKEIYEQGAVETLSQRQLAQKLSADGYPVSQTQVSQMQEAVSYLLAVIPNVLYGGLSRRQIERILRLRRSARSTWTKYAQEKLPQQLDFMEVFQDVLSLFDDSAGGQFDFNRFEDELTGRLAQVFGCTYELIALELSEKCEWQQLIESPPAPELDIQEAPLLTKKQVPAVETMQEQDILMLPLPSKQTREPVVVTRTRVTPADSSISPASERDAQSQEHAGLAGLTVCEAQPFANTHVVSPVDSTPRLQAIESMVGALVGDVEPEPEPGQHAVQSIPVQAGGLYPVTDIWHISAGVDEVGKLRVHIGQLALEIADEMGLSGGVETTDGDMGFICQPLSCADKTGHILLGLLSALSGNVYARQWRSEEWMTFLAELLVGADQPSEVARLSDVAFVKLLRMLRLMRRFHERYDKEETAGTPL